MQLDQVLTALQSRHARRTSSDVLDGLGNALNAKPTAAEDATQDPTCGARPAAEALNEALDDGGRAARRPRS